MMRLSSFVQTSSSSAGTFFLNLLETFLLLKTFASLFCPFEIAILSTRSPYYCLDNKEMFSHKRFLAAFRRVVRIVCSTHPKKHASYMPCRPSTAYRLDVAQVRDSVVNRRLVFVPKFHGWGGVNDRFGFGSFDAMLAYGRRGRFAKEYSRSHQLHSEHFVQHVLKLHGLKVQFYHCAFSFLFIFEMVVLEEICHELSTANVYCVFCILYFFFTTQIKYTDMFFGRVRSNGKLWEFPLRTKTGIIRINRCARAGPDDEILTFYSKRVCLHRRFLRCSRVFLNGRLYYSQHFSVRCHEKKHCPLNISDIDFSYHWIDNRARTPGEGLLSNLVAGQGASGNSSIAETLEVGNNAVTESIEGDQEAEGLVKDQRRQEALAAAARAAAALGGGVDHATASQKEDHLQEDHHTAAVDLTGPLTTGIGG